MTIVAVGCSHSSAPLAVLEPLSIPVGDLSGVLARLKTVTREALVLSTCNRTEIYALVGHAASGADVVMQVLADRVGGSADDLRPLLYAHADGEAVRHALRVASGLDSMVLGEDQIQAQWKRALAHARVAGTLGAVLDRLGAAALSCGKRVRTFTGLGQHTVSLESLAVRAASDRIGGLNGRAVLLIGAGASAQLLARQLRAAYDVRLTVASRSPESAAQFAEGVAAACAPLHDLPRLLAGADVVFSCTSAPHVVVTAEHLRERIAARPGAPLVCVDLGMPRDVDGSVACVPGAQVIPLDEVATLAAAHREGRRQHVPAAESIVNAEVGRFMEWRAARGTRATIGRLQEHARAIAAAEMTQLEARLATLPARERQAVSELAHRIVTRLLHAPAEALKHHPEAEHIALALECAFGLPRAAAAPEAELPGTEAAAIAIPEEAAS